MLTRREAIAVSLGCLVGGPTALAAATRSRSAAGRTLFLGGTGFLGPHMVQRALDDGWDVTLFTRGRTGLDLFPGVTRLVGDRATDLTALQGKRWDVVIDNSGYVPAHVRASAQLLAGSVGHYVFTSTIDAYRDFHQVGITEDYPLAVLPEGALHNPSRYYGALKALCEAEVRSAFPGRSTIIRPGWVVGPRDNGNFFTYWVMRVRRGGEFLAPGTERDPIQMVDARDLAAFVMKAASEKIDGPFTCVGKPVTWGELIRTLQEIAGVNARPQWVDADFLLKQGLRPYFDLPMWWPPRNDYAVPSMPSGLGGGVGAFTISGARAESRGMSYRAIRESARDVLTWYERDVGRWPEKGGPGLAAERERDVLAAWAAR